MIFIIKFKQPSPKQDVLESNPIKMMQLVALKTRATFIFSICSLTFLNKIRQIKSSIRRTFDPDPDKTRWFFMNKDLILLLLHFTFPQKGNGGLVQDDPFPVHHFCACWSHCTYESSVDHLLSILTWKKYSEGKIFHRLTLPILWSFSSIILFVFCYCFALLTPFATQFTIQPLDRLNIKVRRTSPASILQNYVEKRKIWKLIKKYWSIPLLMFFHSTSIGRFYPQINYWMVRKF